MLLTDLVKFCFEVDRQRKSAGRNVWKKDSPSGRTLRIVLSGLIAFLGRQIDDFVLNNYALQHDCSGALPSRRRVSCDAAVKRVQMEPDTIFELISAAKESGLSVREALKLFGNAGRLSNMAGCHPNVCDAWMRRHQAIYDDRATVSFAGATHLNLVADSSRHSNKECLVSVGWSWQHQTAAHCNLQVILPLDTLAAGELDLTSLIEKLAKDRLLFLTINHDGFPALCS